MLTIESLLADSAEVSGISGRLRCWSHMMTHPVDPSTTTTAAAAAAADPAEAR